MAGAWGQGTWNANSWGTDVNTVSVSGIALSLSIGNTEAFHAEGWGANTWSFGNWGEVPNSDVLVTGVSASTSISAANIEVFQEFEVSGIALQTNIGNSDQQILNNGWGIKSWGFGAWGLSGNTLLTGQSATVSLSSPTIVIDHVEQVSSVSASVVTGIGVSRIDHLQEVDSFAISTFVGNQSAPVGNAIVQPTGIALAPTTGTLTVDPTFLIGEGWGRDTYGNLGWGVNYSVIGGGVNGIPMSASIGNEDAFTDFTVEVTFSGALQTAITPVGTVANSDTEIAHSFHIQGSIGTLTFVGHANVPVTGNSTSVNIGQAEGGTLQEVPVTGQSLTTNIGNSDQIGTGIVQPSGLPITITQSGDITIEFAYDVTGASASTNVGQVDIVGTGVVVPTGIVLTSATISPNIIAWAEVDVGTPVTWTEVDLAA
jgi:hypothetical protein